MAWTKHSTGQISRHRTSHSSVLRFGRSEVAPWKANLFQALSSCPEELSRYGAKTGSRSGQDTFHMFHIARGHVGAPPYLESYSHASLVHLSLQPPPKVHCKRPGPNVSLQGTCRELKPSAEAWRYHAIPWRCRVCRDCKLPDNPQENDVP